MTRFEQDLVCARCLTTGVVHALDELECSACAVRYAKVDGVPVLLANVSLAQQIAGGSAGDSRAEFYQSHDEFLRETTSGHEALPTYEKQTRGIGVVLEIGSGRGAFANMGGDDYVALDLSLSALKRLKGVTSRLCASAEEIPLKSGSCRLVFSIATLEHVPNPARAFSEIDCVLRPGGIAYLAPAWHCRDWAADGLPVRPYRDLSPSQKVRKALIPVRDSLLVRGLTQMPSRLVRRVSAKMHSSPHSLAFKPLRANYEHFWMSDSDACASIDSHEAILFFETRGYELLVPTGSAARRVLFRSGAVVARKRS